MFLLDNCLKTEIHINKGTQEKSVTKIKEILENMQKTF